MSRPETDALAPLPAKDGEPVFGEAWQAQALAMADSLVKAGHLQATDWAEALGAELNRRFDAGAADTAETYYLAVLSALEGLLDNSGAVTTPVQDRRREEWRKAYLATPHGKPVLLENGRD